MNSPSPDVILNVCFCSEQKLCGRSQKCFRLCFYMDEKRCDKNQSQDGQCDRLIRSAVILQSVMIFASVRVCFFFVTFIDVIVHFWLVHCAVLFVCGEAVNSYTVDIKCLLLTVTQNVLLISFLAKALFRYQISPNDRTGFTGFCLFSCFLLVFLPFSIRIESIHLLSESVCTPIENSLTN